MTTTISLFTPVSYVRPRSYAEGTLSTLSHYFYLGGNRAKVIRNDEVQLETGKISWHTIALKVASYILLFPLTLTLLAINLGLRYQYNFTVIHSSARGQNLDEDSSTPSSQKQRVIFPTSLNQKSSEDPFEFNPEPKKTTHSVELEENKDTDNSKEEILDTLTQCADREDNAFLIDFSRINPSNIFKIFVKGSRCSSVYGDVAIDDSISYDESHKFTHNFPFKFSISVVTIEKNRYGYNTSSSYMFTMNNEGRVESYGKVFDNFDLYLDYFIKKRVYLFSFEHLDFHSIWDKNEYKKLRKKSSN